MSLINPAITVLISTYDDREYVEKKLVEVRAQTIFSRAEFIFIEPASPGAERELLEPFCEVYENCKVITPEKRASLYQAWNIGWKAASAPLVCITNMDDAMHPRLLEEVVESMAKSDWDIATVLIAKQRKDADWNSWDFRRVERLKMSTRPGAFFVWKADLSESLGYFDETFEIVADKEFWSRALSKNLKVGLIEKVLYLYTKHKEQLSKREEYLELKNEETVKCSALEYPYQWPKALSLRVRRLRLLMKIPLLGASLKKAIYLKP